MPSVLLGRQFLGEVEGWSHVCDGLYADFQATVGGKDSNQTTATLLGGKDETSMQLTPRMDSPCQHRAMVSDTCI